MKRFLFLFTTLALLALLCACGQTEAETSEPSASESQTITTDNAVQITLSDSGTKITGSGASEENGAVTVTSGGTYTVTGTLTDGRILVNAPKQDVTLVLQDASVTCSYGSPLYIYKAASVTVYLPDGTHSTLTDGESYTFADSLSSEADEEPNACLYSKADLVLSGSGTLEVNANYHNGVTSKDTLLIENVTLAVTAENHGVTGKDSCTVRNAVLNITSGGDALRSTNDSDEALGFIDIADSVLTLNAGEDGVQAETKLTVSGSDFTVTTGGGSGATLADDASAKGLKAGVLLTVESGNFTLECADDALHSNGDALIEGGTFEIKTGDDGVHADGNTTVSGGTLNITECYEGLEGATVDITGGEIHIVASDDGINAAGGNDQSGFGPWQDAFSGSSEYYINISGGVIYIDASGDGIDSNGDLTVAGGEIYIDGPTSDGDGALDYDGTGTITGGTLVAVGSNGMVMNFGSNSTQGSILLNLSGAAGDEITVKDSSGTVLLSHTPGKSYRSVVVSCAGLTQGESYTVTAGSQQTTVTLDSLIYGSGMGMGQPGGMGGNPGTPPDGNGGQNGQPTPPDGNGTPGTPPDGFGGGQGGRP